MLKKYDYHSAKTLGSFYFVAIAIPILMSLYLIIIIPDLFGKLFFSGMIALILVIAALEYHKVTDTTLEVREEGIFFKCGEKQISSTWSGIQQIRMLTPIKGSLRYKIYTTNGSFKIGMMELVNDETTSLFDFDRRCKIVVELIDEIKKRAPHAAFTYSLLVRPL